MPKSKMTMTKLALIAAAALCHSSLHVDAFSSISSSTRCVGKTIRRVGSTIPTTNVQSSLASFRLHEGLSDDDNEIDSPSTFSSTTNTSSSCWNPNLRKIIASISTLGILETAYLTYDKFQYTSSGGGASLITALCSDNGGGCKDVLHGPYASIHLGTVDVPLSVLGVMAYTMVLSLAVFPLLFQEGNEQTSNGGDSEEAAVVVQDGQNRIALLGVTTLMASFSIYLVSLIIGVLHASCLFCFLSAGFSVSLAGLSWFGGMLPGSSLSEEVSEGMDKNVLLNISELRKNGMTAGASSVGLATAMALGIFLTVDDTSSTMPSAANSGTLLASTSKTARFEENAPPAITTTSSKAALALAADLNSLDARMFGAFWCSHCYDQKQALGYEAMQTIPYIECDREGYNSKRDFCKEKDVPGYPTWEIGGKLYPGERSVEELREMVDEILSSK